MLFFKLKIYISLNYRIQIGIIMNNDNNVGISTSFVFLIITKYLNISFMCTWKKEILQSWRNKLEIGVSKLISFQQCCIANISWTYTSFVRHFSKIAFGHEFSSGLLHVDNTTINFSQPYQARTYFFYFTELV